jgi:hypothetical protein
VRPQDYFLLGVVCALAAAFLVVCIRDFARKYIGVRRRL